MELKELIERVRAATGPDKDLSRDILTAVGGWAYEKRGRDAKAWMYGPQGYRRDPPGVGAFGAPHVTKSIDAALALVERCLPGWGVETTKPAGGAYGSARIYPGTSFEANGKQTAFGKSANVPLAIIFALLTALDQKEENK